MDNYAYTSFGLTGSTTSVRWRHVTRPWYHISRDQLSVGGECFVVIGGSPKWKSGDEPWRRVGAGSIIYRPLNGAEGKRPGKEPMLALYAWVNP